MTEGLGVTALPSLTLPVLGSAGLVVRNLRAPVMIRNIGLVHLAQRTLSPAAAAFREWIKEAMEKTANAEMFTTSLGPAGPSLQGRRG